MRLVRFNLLSASDAPETVVTGVGIPDTYFRFQIPMPAKYKSVTVGDTASDEPPLIAGVLQFTEVRSKKIHIEIDAADIILSAMQISSEIGATKAVT